MCQPSRPMIVNIVGDARKRGKPCVDVLEDVSLTLYRARRPRRQLVAAARGPALDHLAPHLDVALEADVPAGRKRLPGIEGMAPHARGALRQSERRGRPFDSPAPLRVT